MAENSAGAIGSTNAVAAAALAKADRIAKEAPRLQEIFDQLRGIEKKTSRCNWFEDEEDEEIQRNKRIEIAQEGGPLLKELEGMVEGKSVLDSPAAARVKQLVKDVEHRYGENAKPIEKTRWQPPIG